MTRKWRWAFPIGIALIGIIVGSFLDLQINQGIYSQGNWFGVVMAAFGASPVYMMLSALGVGYFLFALKDKRWWMKAGLIFLTVACILVSIYFQGDMLMSKNAFNIEDKWYIGYPVGVVVSAIGCTLGYFLFRNVDDNKHILWVMVMMPAVLCISILLVDIIKSNMCRPRFRFLVGPNGELDMFKNWWQSGKDLFAEFGKNFKDEFRSFPSGHTVTTTSLIPFLAWLPHIDERFKKAEPYLFYGPLVWAIIMAFSRMLIGAHFLTDVSFAMLISTTVGFAIDMVCIKNKPVVALTNTNENVTNQELNNDNNNQENIDK